MSNTDVLEFLRRLTINVRAVDFDSQFNLVLQHLKTHFNCRQASAEYFFYNSALAAIREIAIKSAAADRRITKAEFLRKINKTNVLFDEWLIQKKGKKAHYANLRQEYFTLLNISPFERFFLFEIDSKSYDRANLKELLFITSMKWSKLTKREPTPFCPYVYVHGLTDSELVELKNELQTEEFRIIDGHNFQGANFDSKTIAQQATPGNKIRLKILNSLDALRATVTSINKTRKVYQFYLNTAYFVFDDTAVHHVKIQVESPLDIKTII
ncbi:DUF4297 family anti-phage-associated protein [Derxia lacustris]|uniref:DUF4297 family anti-phage-associated protein n=1 Tax=Derxia lacustris TaxID=764842 RepID=UPI001F44B316|nr:DUF4297 family anti-phage-associated protein [Derxia lacustris]